MSATPQISFLDLREVTAMHGDEIRRAVADTVDSGRYLQGEAVARFERDYAAYIGTRHAVGVASGLDALYLILRAAVETGRLRPGDEVIVPANTYIASMLAISDNGLVPVPAEPDPVTMQLDGTRLEQYLSPRTRALMLVHLYGHCACTPAILEFCSTHDLMLVEDNAQAHGCRYGSRRTGSIGFAAAHSFYPGKNLGALGDAGAVTTDSDELASTVRQLANYGSSSKYVFRYQGINSRMDEIQAAALDVKLKYLDADNDRRRQIARRYIDGITRPDIQMPHWDIPEQNVFHIFPVRTDRRDELRAYLDRNGVQTLIHYPIPPHRQECYPQWHSLSLPVTERIHRTELSLPISPAMPEQHVDRVIQLVNEFPPAVVS